ncbi:FYDLN acid domain-containing protein [Paracoccus contaminans]|uniref:TIGR02300 family protein n=1 Tax=Paracoccus contaminans TaxID=1945662 RepID=A0A1W6D087_9RHOB|nr:FYDLN acid domain-containing protein [Paracoccus contaminans]ARJ70532.1 hypothetical protein B0A89_13725 [Paracoccus contaminans]
MPKEEWGTKRLCPVCAARFYDLRNDPMTCPACGSEFSAESLTSARTRSMIAEKAASRDAADEDVIDDDLDNAPDAGELDDDLLDDDDDDGDVSLDDIADVAESDEE